MVIKYCEHNYTYLSGRDYNHDINPDVDNERVCQKCGLIGLLSILANKWIEVGYIQDHFPEETKLYVEETI